MRKISYGEGVERVFPLYSPMIDSIKLVRRGKVRRAKLYYLRGLRGKSARIAERQDHARPRAADVIARADVRDSDAIQKGRLVRPFCLRRGGGQGRRVLGAVSTRPIAPRAVRQALPRLDGGARPP